MSLSDRIRSFHRGLGAFRPRPWPTLGAALVVVTTLGLCGWQLQRDGERNQHLPAAQAAWGLARVDQASLAADLDGHLFRDVALTGAYQAPVMLEGGRRVAGGVGYGVLQPFVTTSGLRLLVNRGNLRRADLEPGIAALTQGEPQTLHGQLRPLPQGRSDAPVTSAALPPIWGRRNIGAMHAWVGDLAPGVYLWAGEPLSAGQEPAPDPLLATGYGPVVRDNTSLHYAKQWLALAIIIGLLWGWASFEANQRRA